MSYTTAPTVTLGCQKFGKPIPPSTQHAISFSLPTWQDSIDYNARKKEVMALVETGYPRFFKHRSVQVIGTTSRIPSIRTDSIQFESILKEKFGVVGEDCMIFRSSKIADQCEAYLLHRAVQEGTSATVRVVQCTIHPENPSPQTNRCAELHIAFYPNSVSPFAIEFWQHGCLGISSRFAGHCISLLPSAHKSNPETPGILTVNRLSGTLEPVDTLKDRSTGAFAKLVLRTRIVRAITTGEVQNVLQPEGLCVGARDVIKPVSKGDQDVTEDDVFLFPTGMAAIWNAYNHCLRARPQGRSVIFGMPYFDTLKLLEKWGPGVHLFRHGDGLDLGALERLLMEESPMLSLFTELPLNPLLRPPDLPRLRTLADMYGFLLVVDETVGNFVNVEVLPYADIVVTSLTKMFSGEPNVMGGSLVLNPKGRHYTTLVGYMADCEDVYFDEDAVVMERNSRDLVQRVRIIDANTEALCAYLREHSVAGGAFSAVIKGVLYPKYHDVTPTGYLQCKRPGGGYGGLFSLTFTSLATSKAFFDALPCFKGPNVGTNFTLAIPYTVFVLPTEVEWAEQHGMEEGMVRVSVGLEDRELLLRAFATALKAVESAPQDGAHNVQVVFMSEAAANCTSPA